MLQSPVVYCKTDMLACTGGGSAVGMLQSRAIRKIAAQLKPSCATSLVVRCAVGVSCQARDIIGPKYIKIVRNKRPMDIV
jgi:hypothetical protein